MGIIRRGDCTIESFSLSPYGLAFPLGLGTHPLVDGHPTARREFCGRLVHPATSLRKLASRAGSPKTTRSAASWAL